MTCCQDITQPDQDASFAFIPDSSVTEKLKYLILSPRCVGSTGKPIVLHFCYLCEFLMPLIQFSVLHALKNVRLPRQFSTVVVPVLAPHVAVST